MHIGDTKIIDDKEMVNFKADKEERIEIAVSNSEDRMIKNIEVGLIFPLDFIIEKKDYYSLYIDKESQIVRYETESIQGRTRNLFSPLVIKPLKKGSYTLKTFIKAENIRAIYRKVAVTIG